MTEEDLLSELESEPFVPFRLHLVSGKTVDVLAANAAHTLHDSLLVLKNPTIGTPRADGYDVLAYRNIERIERLNLGKRPTGKRKPAQGSPARRRAVRGGRSAADAIRMAVPTCRASGHEERLCVT